jgi:hypothetical protein
MGRFIDFGGLQDVMAPLVINLMVGLGDTRRRAQRSLRAAIEARAELMSTLANKGTPSSNAPEGEHSSG